MEVINQLVVDELSNYLDLELWEESQSTDKEQIAKMQHHLKKFKP